MITRASRLACCLGGLAMSLVASGCANPPLETTHYLLRAPLETSEGARTPGGETTAVASRTGLGAVTVAPYIERPGIVVLLGDRRVRAASQHAWAEPLPAALRSTLRAELSRALGEPVRAAAPSTAGGTRIVDVHFETLHATMQGTAELEASFRIRTSSQTDEYRFRRSVSLPREGYSGVVEATEALVAELANAVAARMP